MKLHQRNGAAGDGTGGAAANSAEAQPLVKPFGKRVGIEAQPGQAIRAGGGQQGLPQRLADPLPLRSVSPNA